MSGVQGMVGVGGKADSALGCLKVPIGAFGEAFSIFRYRLAIQAVGMGIAGGKCRNIDPRSAHGVRSFWEYWSDGVVEYWGPSTPLLHHSSTPLTENRNLSR